MYFLYRHILRYFYKKLVDNNKSYFFKNWDYYLSQKVLTKKLYYLSKNFMSKIFLQYYNMATVVHICYCLTAIVHKKHAKWLYVLVSTYTRGNNWFWARTLIMPWHRYVL